MEFFRYRNQLKPERGRLLISEPFLPDPNFERTVVFLCEHNEEGSLGFVINKPSILKPGDVLDDLSGQEGFIYIGGPVQQDTLHFLHRNADVEDSIAVRDGIGWGGSFEELLERITTGQLQTADVRFFIGYSGWGPGQLETELEAESWIVSDSVTDELVFDLDPDKIWREALSNLGGRFTVYSRYPTDPRLN